MEMIIIHTKDDAEVPLVYHHSGDKVTKMDVTMGAAETSPVKTTEGETTEKTTAKTTTKTYTRATTASAKTNTKTNAKTSAKTDTPMEKMFDEMIAPSSECLGNKLRFTVANYNAVVVQNVYEKIRILMTSLANFGIEYLLLYKTARKLTLRDTTVIHDGVTDKAMDLIIALLVGQKIKVTPTKTNEGTKFELTF